MAFVKGTGFRGINEGHRTSTYTRLSIANYFPEEKAHHPASRPLLPTSHTPTSVSAAAKSFEIKKVKFWELPGPHWIGIWYTMKTTSSKKSVQWNIYFVTLDQNPYVWSATSQSRKQNNKISKGSQGTASDTSLWLQWNISNGLGCASNPSTEGITNKG